MQVGDVEPLVLGMEPRRNHGRRSAYRAVCVLATIDPQLSPATVMGPVRYFCGWLLHRANAGGRPVAVMR
jgi:hypothetical protein